MRGFESLTWSKKSACNSRRFAEGEGFEPPGRYRPTVFKTAAIDHSANLPDSGGQN